ncbi:MAG: LicD family protein [Promethearchaeota archaeon]
MPTHEQIKEALLKFKKVMNEAGIIFWIEYGTLLGAIREGKIIDWDTDGDVGVWIDDIPKMKKLETKFLLEGLRIDYQPSHPFVNLKINNRETIAVLDVYPFDIIKWKNQQWIVRIIEGKLFNVRAPANCYVSELDGRQLIKKINFLDSEFLVPYWAEEALEFLYGKTWRTPIKRNNSKKPVYGKGGWAKRVQLEDL